MATKTLRLELTGDSSIIDPALDSFSKHFGWKKGEGPTKLQVAKKAIVEFIKKITIDYDAKQEAKTASNNSVRNNQTAFTNLTSRITEV